MNEVMKIKARAEARKWADIEGIMRVMQPTLEANAKARWEAEVKASKNREKAVRAKNGRARSTWPCAVRGFPCGCCEEAVPGMWVGVERVGAGKGRQTLHLPTLRRDAVVWIERVGCKT